MSSKLQKITNVWSDSDSETKDKSPEEIYQTFLEAKNFFEPELKFIEDKPEETANDIILLSKKTERPKSEDNNIYVTSEISVEVIFLSGLGKHPIYALLLRGLYETMYIISPNSQVPTGIYPSGSLAVSTLPLPMSFYNDISLPLNVMRVALRADVSIFDCVLSGAKSITNPSLNIFLADNTVLAITLIIFIIFS